MERDWQCYSIIDTSSHRITHRNGEEAFSPSDIYIIPLLNFFFLLVKSHRSQIFGIFTFAFSKPTEVKKKKISQYTWAINDCSKI